MKKSYAAISASVVMLGISGTALGQVITTLQAGNSLGCAYFQVAGSGPGGLDFTPAD
jgi:hypothetical protein